MWTARVKAGHGATRTRNPPSISSPARLAPACHRLVTGGARGALPSCAATAGAHRHGASPPWPGGGQLPRTRTPRRRGAGAAHLLAAAPARCYSEALTPENWDSAQSEDRPVKRPRDRHRTGDTPPATRARSSPMDQGRRRAGERPRAGQNKGRRDRTPNSAGGQR